MAEQCYSGQRGIKSIPVNICVSNKIVKRYPLDPLDFGKYFYAQAAISGILENHSSLANNNILN